MANILNWRDQIKFTSGDTVRVHQTVKEGDKTRTQIFEGIVVRIRGHKGLKSFTVRKIATGGVGVERIFPELTTTVTKIEVTKKGKVRRANLNYLRERVGKKATRVKDQFVKIEKGETEVETNEEELQVVKKRAEKAIPEKTKKTKAEKAEKPKKEKKKKKIVRKEKVFVR